MRTRNTVLWLLLAGLAPIGSRHPEVYAQGKNAHDAPILPLRRDTADSVVQIPNLPTSAQNVTPLLLTASIQTRYSNARMETLKQTISRTSDRIHVATMPGVEWLFERNSVDHRRVSGSLIDHSLRTIIVYEESDLRNMLGIRGWIDVLAMGVDIDLLNQLKVTGQSKGLSGFTFVRYLPNSKQGFIQDAWWNRDFLFPSTFVTSDGDGTIRTFKLERIGTKVDEEILRRPSVRFPTYRVVDLAEWLEEH
jgi:hypothetical protein